MKNCKKIILFICLTAALVLPWPVLAANPALEKLNNVATVKGPFRADASWQVIVGTVVGIALSLVGTIFLLLMIYAGYNWMTAQGDEEKVTKAKTIIIQAVIGIVIVVGAYASWKFLFSKLFL